MRQRITYLQDPNDSLDPKLLKVTDNSISTKEIKAAREERITIGLTEGLPWELLYVLKASHELHIRWVTEADYESISPLVARLSPGLHVFYTPESGKQSSEEDAPSLCRVLSKVFGDMDCISPEESFTTLPTERFSHTTTHQYYTSLPSLKTFESYLQDKVCASLPPTLQTPCLERISSLPSATDLEIDYMTINHALTISSYHPPSVQPIAVSHPFPSSRLEVGILSVSEATQPEEISLGGFLTVVGEDTKPKATLFSFPSRHHLSSGTFSTSFLQPTGLHPVLQLSISESKPPKEDAGCKLHAHLTLPKSIFIDKYQFSDPLFLTSKNLSGLHYISTPIDLEAPSYALTQWGSTALFSLAPPSPLSFTAEIPTHTRYLPPSHNTSGLAEVEIPYPAVFWACTAEEGTKFSTNPFERVNLGFDGLFGRRTVFYHLTPTLVSGEERLVNRLEVPVLDLDKAGWVEAGTGLVIAVGFAWVLWCSVGVWWRSGTVGVVSNEKKKA